MDASLTQSLLIALSIGVASGSIGAFIILKRMALVGDALSHVALPGIALALLYHLDPLWGVLSFLLAAAVVVWWLERSSKLPADAIVGLLFTTSLAIGMLIIPDTEVLESLFGEFPSLPLFLIAGIVGAAISATIATYLFARKFLFTIVSQDLARTSGIQSSYDLALLLIFSLVVALGIKLVGALLMGALTIIPAATARNVAKGMKEYLVLASLLGGLIAASGVVLAWLTMLRPGPIIILLGIGLFVTSFFFVKK